MTLQEPLPPNETASLSRRAPSECASYKKRATARHLLEFLPEFFGCRSDLTESF